MVSLPLHTVAFAATSAPPGFEVSVFAGWMELDFVSVDSGTIGRRTLMMVPSGFRTLTILKAFGASEAFLSVVVFVAGVLGLTTDLAIIFGFAAGVVAVISVIFELGVSCSSFPDVDTASLVEAMMNEVENPTQRRQGFCNSHWIESPERGWAVHYIGLFELPGATLPWLLSPAVRMPLPAI